MNHEYSDATSMLTTNSGSQSQLSLRVSGLEAQLSEKPILTVPHLPSASAHQREGQRPALPESKYHSPEMIVEEEAAIVLPPQRYSGLWRKARWAWLSVYRRLCLLVMVPNIMAMVILGARNNLLDLPLGNLADAVAANLLVATLMRQELVINLLFSIFGKCPLWFPLRIRRLSAKIYHFGGVHSGAGIAAAAWFLVFLSAFGRAWMKASIPGIRSRPGLLFLTVAINVLFLLILGLAHPAIRSRWHNRFEATHRFAGWTAVALFWIELFLLADFARTTREPPPSLGQSIVSTPAFWFLVVITISLILPWLRLRKVLVVPEILSDHAVRLHFNYRRPPLCAGIRVSDSPLV